MWISRYVCLFLIYSCMGWIYETLFCTIKGGKWENRGFLYGPVCPIYGVGAVAIVAVMNWLTNTINYPFHLWQIFLISVFGSMILEYVTSWGLEKLFHAVWWDYSNLPLNINGRISLLTSLGFGVAGVLVVYVIAPFTEKIVDAIPPIWIEFFALFFTVFFVIDTTLTISGLTHFERVVVQMEKEWNERMDSLVDSVKGKISEERKEFGEKVHSVGQVGQSAIRRVKKFTYTKKYNEKVNILIEELKKKF